MARASFIYIIRDKLTRDIVGLFTVKREALFWAKDGYKKPFILSSSRDGFPPFKEHIYTEEEIINGR
jgi:hypothetical protein